MFTNGLKNEVAPLLRPMSNTPWRSPGFIASKIQDVKTGNIARLVFASPKKGDKIEGVGNVAPQVVKTILLQKQGTPVEPAKTAEKKRKKN